MAVTNNTLGEVQLFPSTVLINTKDWLNFTEVCQTLEKLLIHNYYLLFLMTGLIDGKTHVSLRFHVFPAEITYWVEF